MSDSDLDEYNKQRDAIIAFKYNGQHMSESRRVSLYKGFGYAGLTALAATGMVFLGHRNFRWVRRSHYIGKYFFIACPTVFVLASSPLYRFQAEKSLYVPPSSTGWYASLYHARYKIAYFGTFGILVATLSYQSVKNRTRLFDILVNTRLYGQALAMVLFCMIVFLERHPPADEEDEELISEAYMDEIMKLKNENSPQQVKKFNRQ